MADARMRALEREAAAGDVDARARLLRERLRSGRAAPERVALAAFVGDPASRLALGEAPRARDVLPCAHSLYGRWGAPAAVRGALAALAAPLAAWRGLPPDSPEWLVRDLARGPAWRRTAAHVVRLAAAWCERDWGEAHARPQRAILPELGRAVRDATMVPVGSGARRREQGRQPEAILEGVLQLGVAVFASSPEEARRPARGWLRTFGVGIEGPGEHARRAVDRAVEALGQPEGVAAAVRDLVAPWALGERDPLAGWPDDAAAAA